MKRLKSKSEEKHFNNVAKSVLKRQSKFFRRNVHINHIETYLNILRIKNEEQFDEEILGYKALPRDICFMFYHIDPFMFPEKLYSIVDSDVIITNSANNKVIAINQELKNYSEFVNVWIVKKNTVDYLSIEIGDIFFTR